MNCKRILHQNRGILPLLREELNVEAFAELAGVAPRAVEHTERGKLEEVTDSEAEALVRVYFRKHPMGRSAADALRDAVEEARKEDADEQYVKTRHEELRLLRERAKLSQVTIARIAMVAPPYINRVEKGRREGLSADSLRRVLETYETLRRLVNGDQRNAEVGKRGCQADEPRPGG